ncbi:MAG: hypothetical protein ACM3JG_15540 [Thiohalocapsa sp.]
MADFHYPVALPPEALRSCRVVVNRGDLAGLLPKRRQVVQLGAGFGELSEVILGSCSPQKLTVLDPFILHTIDGGWEARVGQPGLDHQQHFRKQFAAPLAQGQLEMRQGEIFELIEQLPDRGVGIAWIADDTKYAVIRDHLKALLPKMLNDGQIVISNYIMSDYLTGEVYGVIQAANEFIVAERWEMIGFALQSSMFCDVVIRRSR